MGGLNPWTMFSDTWKLDLITLTWQKLPMESILPVYFHSTAFDEEEGRVVTFGGVTNMENNERTNMVQSCYFKISSLKHMAWEALLYYYDLENKPKELLREQGIPEFKLRSLCA